MGNKRDHLGAPNGTRSRSDSRGPRSLIIIGGHEDKEDEKTILQEVARRLGPASKLVVTTVASHEPEGYFEQYETVFRELGVRELANLEISSRAEALDPARLAVLDDATGVFFTGGDQLKITSQIGDTPIFQRLLEIHLGGGVIAGTSAGASVMSETMMVRGTSDETYRLGDTLNMAPGLGLISGVLIDQHFAERGRMGRLLGAVAQNPRVLGLGIDENTAIVVENEERFTVLGAGAVYVLDGAGVTHSNVSESAPPGAGERSLSIHDVKVHVLCQGDGFDLRTRRPGALSPRAVAEIQMKEATIAAPGPYNSEG